MFNKKVILIITLLFLIGGSFVCCPNKAFAYSTTPTHPNLTKEMIRLYNMYYDPDISGEVYNRIVQGSIDEDMAPRWTFHLYDPVYNRAPFGVVTAKEWATYSAQGTVIRKFANVIFNLFGSTKFSYHGDFSWDKNIENFTKNKTDEAWYGLGHILHLIADMTVPAHSRNDHHIQGDPFESWTGANLTEKDYNLADSIYEKYKINSVGLIFVSEAFDELANYSNKYFFSKDSVTGTNLGNQYNDPKIVDIKEFDYGKYITKFYVMSEDENGKLFKSARVDALRSNWNKYAPGLTSKIVYEIPENDEKLHLDYWKRLAPKAVQYGTAVIKLFVENAEYEKQKLIHQQNPLNMAQVVNTNTPNAQETNNVILIDKLPTDVRPGGLPQARSVIIEPVDPPVEVSIETSGAVEVSSNVPSTTPSDNKDVAQEKKKENQKNNQNQSIVVTGPTTGGGGGVAPGSIKQEESPTQENENTEPSPEPNPEPKPEPEPEPAIETRPHLLINEIQVRDNEFVELYNPTSSSIDLSGHYLSYYAQNNDWDDPHRNQEFPASASIEASGYYLIGLKGYSTTEGNPKADWQPYDSNQLSNTHGSIAIFPFDPKTKIVDENKAEVIDVVAWNDVIFVKEGTEFQQTLGVDKSMQRINFQDNDDNNNDFEYKTVPSPTNSKGQVKVNGTSIPDNLVINEDATWTIAGSPYYIMSNKNKWPVVEAGVTLTIEPGVIIMPENPHYTFLEIRGTLKAEGTIDNKIVFTPKTDSDYGGTGEVMAGDMQNILFTPTSVNSVFDYVLFRYGGKNGEVIQVNGSDIEIKNSIIEKSQRNGIYLNNSNSKIKNTIIKNGTGTGIIVEGSGNTPEISDCQINNYAYGIDIKDGTAPKIKNNSFSENATAPIYLRDARPEFSNNSAINNAYNGIMVGCLTLITQDTTWDKGLVYILEMNSGDYVTINENVTLTIKPGAILKPINHYYTPLVIKGTLRAEGSSGNEIIFTSIKDDTMGGDTNNDSNATTPTDSDWKKIIFETTSTGSVLDNVKMFYGSGEPELVGSASVEIKTVDYTP